MNFAALALLLLVHPLGGVHARISGGDAEFRRLQRTQTASTSCLAGAVASGDMNASHEVEGFECNADSLLGAIEVLMNGVEACKRKSARDEFSILVGTDAAAAKNLCISSEKRWHQEHDNPFVAILNEGEMVDKEFFDGNTAYNTMRQTNFELGSGPFASHVLEDDAGRFARILQASKTAGIGWPGYASQFESCELRAAMCCWSQDRQANDNSGSCGIPYDTNCQDASPDDNTDICYVDMERSPLSNHVQDGFAIYGGDDQDGEGSANCHGFAWPSDPSDARSRYVGNNLFFVSMYDHLYQRGYVREIPGAPMCACVEQMPTVSTAGCTQLDVDETWELHIGESGKLDARIVKINIDFNTCQGANDKDNDLSAYYEQLRDDGDATDEEVEELANILVGEGNCSAATSDFLHSQGLPGGLSEVYQNATFAVVKTDQYIYPAEAVVSITVLTRHKVVGDTEMVILPVAVAGTGTLPVGPYDDLAFFEDSYKGAIDGPHHGLEPGEGEGILFLPGSDGWSNGKALSEGSWRAVLLRHEEGETLVLAKSEVFTVLGPDDNSVGLKNASSAIIETDQYIYAEESVMSIYVSNTHKVEGYMGVGILPAKFENDTAKDLPFEVSYEYVHGDDVLLLPLSRDWNTSDGEGSSRDDGHEVGGKIDGGPHTRGCQVGGKVDACGMGSFCRSNLGSCDGSGTCIVVPKLCTAIMEPVCGCDGRTYSSQCAAYAAGVSVAGAGECREGDGLFRVSFTDPVDPRSALSQGSWRAVLFERNSDGDATLILAKSEVFTVLGPRHAGLENVPPANVKTDAPPANVKTDQYVYAEEAVVSIYVSTAHKIEGSMEMGILLAESEFSENDDVNGLAFEVYYRGVHNGTVLSLPSSPGRNTTEALQAGSWRAVLFKDTLILAKSDVFTILGPRDAGLENSPCDASVREKHPASVKIDHYLYAEEPVSIRVSTTNSVGIMEIGILPAEFIFENDDANDLVFEASFHDVHDGDLLSLPVLDASDDRKALGKGSWRAVLLEISNGDVTILAKSEVFTVVGPPTSVPSSYWATCGRKGACAKKDREENVPANTAESHKIRCCADELIHGSSFSRKPLATCPDVLATSKGCTSGTYSMAVEHCEALGGRLCTRDELEQDCTKGSGCGFDFELIWSSTPSDRK